jgi:hypothetical protein
LLTRMTGNSLHMQWPLTSLSCMAVSLKENNRFFVADQTPRLKNDLKILNSLDASWQPPTGARWPLQG